jgi:hypothetical protein
MHHGGRRTDRDNERHGEKTEHQGQPGAEPEVFKKVHIPLHSWSVANDLACFMGATGEQFVNGSSHAALALRERWEAAGSGTDTNRPKQ